MTTSKRSLERLRRARDHPARVREQADDLFGAGERAVRHADACRIFRQQRGEHAARGAAGAENQDRLAGKGHVEVVHQVADDAGTVGVVAVPMAVAAAQRVDRAGELRAWRQHPRHGERLLLERHRDVAAAPTVARERLDRRLEAVERRQQPLVAQVLAGLRRERHVDLRRLRLRDRVADDGVAVRHQELRDQGTEALQCSVAARRVARTENGTPAQRFMTSQAASGSRDPRTPCLRADMELIQFVAFDDAKSNGLAGRACHCQVRKRGKEPVFEAFSRANPGQLCRQDPRVRFVPPVVPDLT